MHYAVHGHTAAELIVERANAEKEHMGLTTWENAPDGKIVKPDVSIAKNYLKQIELEDMGRLINGVLDIAERMANRHIPMTMEDWSKRIDIILEAGGDAVLKDTGTVSADALENIEGKVSIHYVGYYYNALQDDCVQGATARCRRRGTGFRQVLSQSDRQSRWTGTTHKGRA